LGDMVALGDADARHAAQVLRLRPGALVLLVDGRGGVHEARIESMGTQGVGVRVLRKGGQASAESNLSLVLAQGFLKDKKMDALVRPLTEMGVSRWVPFGAQRCVSRPDAGRLAGRLARWEKIAQEALKQCRRGRVLEIEPVPDLAALLTAAADCDLKLVFWEEAATPLRNVLADIDGNVRRVCVLVGPEGGLTAGEVETAAAAGFATVGLGPRILRAETAALAACALVQHRLGDLG